MVLSLRLSVLILCVLALGVPAHSDLLLTLDDAHRTVDAGQSATFSFFGTITNSGSDIDGMGKGTIFQIPTVPATGLRLPNTIQTATSSWPVFLASGQTYTGLIFTFDVGSDAPVGDYVASCRVSYTPVGGTKIESNTVGWYIDVVPEASSLTVLLCGVAGLSTVLFRKRRHNPDRSGHAVLGSVLPYRE